MRRIRMLYRFEKTIARSMISWNEIRIAFNMIDKYTRQCDVAQTSSLRGENNLLLKRIEKATNRLEKLIKNEKQTKTQTKNNWAKIVESASLDASLREDVIVAPLKRKLTKNIKIIIYIKKDSKIERMQKINAIKIVKLIRNLNIASALSTHQDILAIRQHKKIIVFRITLKSNKRILKQNNFWAKKISMTTILR